MPEAVKQAAPEGTVELHGVGVKRRHFRQARSKLRLAQLHVQRARVGIGGSPQDAELRLGLREAPAHGLDCRRPAPET